MHRVQAVGRSVTRLLPWARVFDVEPGGFTVAARARGGSAGSGDGADGVDGDDDDWEPWQLQPLDPARGVHCLDSAS